MPYLVYPERRAISDDRVKAWYADLATDEHMLTFVGPEHPDMNETTKVWDTFYRSVHIDEAIAYLEDAGVATFAQED